MLARSACLVTLSSSEERTWTLRPPAILHRLLPYHTIPYHTKAIPQFVQQKLLQPEESDALPRIPGLQGDICHRRGPLVPGVCKGNRRNTSDHGNPSPCKLHRFDYFEDKGAGRTYESPSKHTSRVRPRGRRTNQIQKTNPKTNPPKKHTKNGGGAQHKAAVHRT